MAGLAQKFKNWVRRMAYSAIAPWKNQKDTEARVTEQRLQELESAREQAGMQFDSLEAYMFNAETSQKTLWEALLALQLRTDRLEARMPDLDEAVLRTRQLEKDVPVIKTQFAQLNQSRLLVEEEIGFLEEKVRNMKAILKWANNAEFQAELFEEKQITTTDNELFYHDFEERFRGSQQIITDRLRQYLPTINAQMGSLATKTCVDIGCGRGEWLDLLKEQGVENCIGIDLNQLQLEICREKGHQVLCQDAVQYLKNQPEGSIDLITGFQIIEHLPFDILLQLFAVSFRALRPGGAVLFETPNTTNLQTGATYFYADPTHIKPLFKGTVQFIAEHSGFEKAEILETNGFDPSVMLSVGEERAPLGYSQNMDILNGFLFGPQDYALWAIKAEETKNG